MSDRRQLGVQDALWLEMDRPNNLMVVDSVIWTDEPLDWDLVRGVLAERLLDRYPVFRSRAVRDDDGSWWWEEDDEFSRRRALHGRRARRPGRPAGPSATGRGSPNRDARPRATAVAGAVRRPLPRRQRHRAALASRPGRRHAHGAAVDVTVRRRSRGWPHHRARGHQHAAHPAEPGQAIGDVSERRPGQHGPTGDGDRPFGDGVGPAGGRAPRRAPEVVAGTAHLARSALTNPVGTGHTLITGAWASPATPWRRSARRCARPSPAAGRWSTCSPPRPATSTRPASCCSAPATTRRCGPGPPGSTRRWPGRSHCRSTT